MKAFAPIATLFFVWPLTALSAQVGKKPVTIDDVVHEEKLVSPGVSRLEWSPGGNHLSFIRPLTVGVVYDAGCPNEPIARLIGNKRVVFPFGEGQRKA